MAKQLTAGDLRHRIILQRPVRTRNELGEVVVTHENVASVWAQINPVQSAEAMRADAPVPNTTHKVTIRHRADVRADWRIAYGSRVMEIAGITTPMEGREWLVMACTEQR